MQSFLQHSLPAGAKMEKGVEQPVLATLGTDDLLGSSQGSAGQTTAQSLVTLRVESATAKVTKVSRETLSRSAAYAFVLCIGESAHSLRQCGVPAALMQTDPGNELLQPGLHKGARLHTSKDVL